MRVRVIDKDGKSLRPCVPAKARILLKKRVAKVVKRMPFTIRLLDDIKGNPEAIYVKEEAEKVLA